MGEKNKLKKIISLSAIIGIFIVVAVIIFGLFGVFKLTKTVYEILGVFTILCFGCICSLPWIDRLYEKKSKIISIVFLSVVAACVVLWTVCWIIIFENIRKDKTITNATNTLVKITLTLSIQFLVASTISDIFLRYRKSMIAFQAITYLSYLYIDIYFSYIILSFKIIKGSLTFSGEDFIFNKIILALLFIAFIYIFIASIVVKSYDKKKINKLVTTNNLGEMINETQTTSINQNFRTIDERLLHLKELFEKELISLEEYENRKAEILKEV